MDPGDGVVGGSGRYRVVWVEVGRGYLGWGGGVLSPCAACEMYSETQSKYNMSFYDQIGSLASQANEPIQYEEMYTYCTFTDVVQFLRRHTR